MSKAFKSAAKKQILQELVKIHTKLLIEDNLARGAGGEVDTQAMQTKYENAIADMVVEAITYNAITRPQLDKLTKKAGDVPVDIIFDQNHTTVLSGGAQWYQGQSLFDALAAIQENL